MRSTFGILLIGLTGIAHAALGAQAPAETGTLTGSVVLEENGDPVHGAVVVIIGLGEFTTTDEYGSFELTNVAAGTWEVLAQREHLTADRETVTVTPGETAEVSFVLALSPVHEAITVTATAGGESTVLDVFNAVTTLDSFELVENIAGTIGEVLEEQPGIAARSFGPGSSRPIIRGFDGDRVLVMQDGVRTGDLGSQSGDHGVSIDPTSLERLEVVKGPATLLYGSSAIGGVVNAITPQDAFRRDPPRGIHGQIVGDLGSVNDQAGANGSLSYGRASMGLWANGGARRTGDYDTPEGPVVNSATDASNATAGIGYFGDRSFLSFGYTREDGRYGVPFAGVFEGEEDALIDIDQTRQVGRLELGFRRFDHSVFDSARFIVSFIDWHHEELETEDGVDTVGTTFDNETLVFRAELEQKRSGGLTGKLGVWGQRRDYVTVGAEALAPPTVQNAYAAFAYQEVALREGLRLQFGGRIENNDYDPEPRELGEEGGEGGEEEIHLPVPEARPRTFTGLSASAGLHADVGASTALVLNFTRAHRAPALEELYNFGPHIGTLSFEIGNPNLEREASFGVDASLRHQGPRFRGEINVYRYAIDRFVFPSFTGEIADGLRVAEFLQGDSRFIGFDGKTSVELHPLLWLHMGVGFVDAELTETAESLPRIPPFHARVELEVPYRGFTVKPELIVSAKQDRVFREETPTDGYLVVNVNGSYILPRRHSAHIFSVKAYNLTNELYRHHTSFIKDLAPQMGRGIKVSYSVRFF